MDDARDAERSTRSGTALDPPAGDTEASRRGAARLAMAITATRLILIPVLWVLAIRQEHLLFAGVLLLAGLTDVVDGALARWSGRTSQRGAWWDSLADNLLGLSSLVWMWLFLEDFLRPQLWLVGLVVAIKLLSFGVGYARYRQLIAYHLLMDKLSGVVYFAFMVHAVAFAPSTQLFYLTLGVSALSSLEEIMATLRFDRMRSDILTILKPDWHVGEAA